MQTTAAETKLSKTSSQNQGIFLILYSKTVQKNLQTHPDSARWAVTDLILPPEEVTALSPGTSAPAELLGAAVLPGAGVTVRWRWLVLECLTPILPLLCPHAGCFPENRHKGCLLSFEERGTSLATILLCVGQFFWKVKTSNYCKLSQAVLLTCIVFKQGNNSHHLSSTGKIIWKFASD